MKQLFIALSLLLASVTMHAQASSSADFSIRLSLPALEKAANLEYYFMEHNGAGIDRCCYMTAGSPGVIHITGSYHYIVGVDFPTLVIRRKIIDTTNREMPERLEYYYLHLENFRYWDGDDRQINADLGITRFNKEQPFIILKKEGDIVTKQYLRSFEVSQFPATLQGSWVEIKMKLRVLL